MWRMKMSDNKLSSVVLTGEEGGKNMRYMRCWHITMKTLTCTSHWFCEKSYEERHIEHLDTLGGRRWVHAVLSTQGFAKEDAAKHAQGHWCPWRSRPTVVVFFGLNMIEHIKFMVLSVSFDKYYKYSHCEATPNRLQASPSIGPWINISNQSWYSWDQTPENPKPSDLVTSDYTEISWMSWQKAFDLQVSFAATSRALRGGVTHCE